MNAGGGESSNQGPQNDCFPSWVTPLISLPPAAAALRPACRIFSSLLSTPTPVSLDPQELPHLIVGPGLEAEVYRDCLAAELRMKEIVFQRDTPLPFNYKGKRIESGLRVNFLIENSVVLSVEAVDTLEARHKNHLKNLLRLTGYEVALLVNFNVENLRDGVKRLIVSETPPALHYRQEPVTPAQENRPVARGV
jgi:GxxExxY protein